MGDDGVDVACRVRGVTMIRTWLEPYALDRCPRCGGALEPVDDNLDRHCPVCRIIINPAECELHEVDA